MEYESKTCESIHALFFSSYWCWFETQFWSDIHVYVGHNHLHLYVFCKTNHITVIGVVISHCSVHRRGKGHTNNFGSIENQETYESRLIRIELLPTGNGMILGSTHIVDHVGNASLSHTHSEDKAFGCSGFHTTRRIQQKRRSGSLKMNLVFIPIFSSLVKLGAGWSGLSFGIVIVYEISFIIIIFFFFFIIIIFFFFFFLAVLSYYWVEYSFPFSPETTPPKMNG